MNYLPRPNLFHSPDQFPQIATPLLYCCRHPRGEFRPGRLFRINELEDAADSIEIRNGLFEHLFDAIGATGTRIVVTLLHEMKRQGARRGLATLCVSGGMGLALLLEACEET